MMFSFLMMVAVASPGCGRTVWATPVALPTASGHKLEPTIAGDSKEVKASRPENPG